MSDPGESTENLYLITSYDYLSM